MTDLSTWIPKAEAAARLGKSERTLDRMGDDGPERRLRPREGLKPEVVFNPDDIEKMVAAQRSKAIAPTSPLAPASTQQLALRKDAPAIALEFQELFARGLEAARRGPGLWLNLAEASAYSGLSIALLRRLIRAGVLLAIRDRAVKVRRADLDNLDASKLLSLFARAAGGGA